MFVQVQLLNGFEKSLLYKVPQEYAADISIGKIVIVPLRQHHYPALVREVISTLSYKPAFTIKSITRIDPFPKDPTYRSFISKIASYACTSSILFYQRIQHFLNEKALEEGQPLNTRSTTPARSLPLLTEEQQAATTHIASTITKEIFDITLLHGVTGSGKTEVYKQLLKTAYLENKTSILLLPEVSLSLQFEYLLQKAFPDIPVIGFHSASKQPDKKLAWQMLCQGKPLIIVGVHQPILLPIANLGLIIIDEEHETGYQEKKHPKINSKEIAILRAQSYNFPVLLGSATPSLTSLANVTKNKWHYFKLQKRFSGAFPTIQKVILTEQQKKRESFWISKELEKAISETLSRKEQIIIYLNRRGYSFFTFCKKCGFIFKCQHCSVSLTPHTNANKTITELRCHYCDYHLIQPNTCPECKAPARQLASKGVGIQQAVEILTKLFPQAAIARADLDATRKKKLWRTTIEEFEQGKINILVGTKTITKGYHFPNVTLVGILWADLNLHLPLYNSQETTLQQLIQVAGRSGRGEKKSKVIVQVMQDHPIFDYINEERYPEFADQELETRKLFNYPPFNRLITIEIRHKQGKVVDKEAQYIANWLRNHIEKNNFTIQLMGPSLPVISKIKNSEIRHILIKTPSFRQASLLISKIQVNKLQSSVFTVVSS